MQQQAGRGGAIDVATGASGTDLAATAGAHAAISRKPFSPPVGAAAAEMSQAVLAAHDRSRGPLPAVSPAVRLRTRSPPRYETLRGRIRQRICAER